MVTSTTPGPAALFLQRAPPGPESCRSADHGGSTAEDHLAQRTTAVVLRRIISLSGPRRLCCGGSSRSADHGGCTAEDHLAQRTTAAVLRSGRRLYSADMMLDPLLSPQNKFDKHTPPPGIPTPTGGGPVSGETGNSLNISKKC